MFVCPICRSALSEDASCPVDGIETVEVPDNLVPPDLGERFGIKGVYGAGDIGALYRAYHAESSTWGLLKVMRLSASASDAGREHLCRDFERQVKLPASSRVNHARSAAVEDDMAWVFREWTDGESLESRIFREDELSIIEAMTLTAKIAQALDELHCAGLVHGSVHPGHVILTPNEEESSGVVLIDAGIVGDAQRGSAFEDLGDLFYMSPEQVRGKAWGFRSDLYALGCVFYEMLTGEPPFDGDTADAVIAAHQYQIPSIPDDLLPSSVAELLTRMLAKVPSDRPMSTREIIATLKPYVGDIEPARQSSRPPAPSPLAQKRRTSSAPPPAVSLAEIAARAETAKAAVTAKTTETTPAVITTLPSPEPLPEPLPEPRRRKRRDPSSIQIVLSDFADVAERTGSFVIQKTARLPWLSLGILIGVLGTAGTAYALALGGQFHFIADAMGYMTVSEQGDPVGVEAREEPVAGLAAASETEAEPDLPPAAQETDETDEDAAEPEAAAAESAETAEDEADATDPSDEEDAQIAQAQQAQAQRVRRLRIRRIRARRRRARRAAAMRAHSGSMGASTIGGLSF